MLSVARVANSSTYYERTDDYYGQDQAPSAWMGRGAADFGLAGPVEADRFAELLDGVLPGGQRVHVGGGRRRGGTDLTFSAPKSVSIAALALGDDRLVEAHDRAVARVVAFVEARVATRQGERPGRLVAAAFRHKRSRAQDPQLHTHVVVINATRDAQGRARALDQRGFYIEKMLLGAAYRAELALEMRALGYALRTTHADGRFELAQISDRQIGAFSQRSAQIEAALAQVGSSRVQATAAEKAAVTTRTRAAKTRVDETRLRERWRAQAVAVGLSQIRPEPSAVPPRAHDPEVRAAVDFAVAHTTERAGVVSQAQLLRHALEVGTGRVGIEATAGELDRRVAAGALEQRDVRYAERRAMQLELDLLRIHAAGRGRLRPIRSVRQASVRAHHSGLGDEQRAALVAVLSSRDRIVGVEGRAGTGKTAMLAALAPEVAHAGHVLVGLAPTGRAARELQQAGVSARTIAAFLHDGAAQAALGRRSVLLVDEAAMVSARTMHRLATLAEQAGARLVLVGDTRQLGSVEAGRAFGQLREAGLPTVTLETVQRQDDLLLRRAVVAVSRGRIDHGLALLRGATREVASAEARYQALAADYAALSASERQQTLVVTGTNAAREAINAAIRTQLGLAEAGAEVLTLRPRDLTAAQARRASSYHAGLVVQAKRAYVSLSLERGTQLRVESADTDRVRLRHPDGRRIDWHPARHTGFVSFEPVARRFAFGERVQFTHGDSALGISNRDFGTVQAATADHLDVHMANGRRVQLNVKRALHIDHGYATTTYGAQGATVDRVMIEVDTRSPSTNRQAFYVQVSRARRVAMLYTDALSRLPQAAARAADKTAALDVWREPASAASPVERSAVPESVAVAMDRDRVQMRELTR